MQMENHEVRTRQQKLVTPNFSLANTKQQSHSVQSQEQPSQADGAILLTGATGFVGGQLLLRLLARDARKIICLIRSSNDQEAISRGLKTLTTLLGRKPEVQHMSRVEWVRADLELNRLGLEDATWQRIASEIIEIFHCAASVEFNLPLEAAQRINVGGVKHLASLAREGGSQFLRFHHVSTAYVSGRTKNRVKADFLPDDRARNFRNTYERTKAQAERLLRHQNDFAVTIYRPSIIAGDTRTGFTNNWNVLYVPMRQIIRGQLPFFRKGGRAIVDSVGVDFVVDGIIALAECAGTRHQAYHLTADRLAFDVTRYVETCNNAAKSLGIRQPTKIVSPLAWTLLTKSLTALRWSPSGRGKLRKRGLAATRAIKSFSPYLAYTSVDAEFDADYEQNLLAERSVRMPPPDLYLETIVGYGINTNFGRDLAPAMIEVCPPSDCETELLSAAHA